MKIAIAASGIGHIFRGMEGWSESMASALFESGIDVTLFKGAGPLNNPYEVCIPSIKRTSQLAHILSKLNRIGGWRVGVGSKGQIEAWTYGLFLLSHLRKGFDLVHIKQGNLANFLRYAQKAKILKIPFILSNGQIARPDFINRFKYVQFLSPHEKSEMEKILGPSDHWFTIPNFVNTDKFIPLSKPQCRKKLKIPDNKFVILTVGAIKKYHKRMDYFLNEMDYLINDLCLPVHVIIAGSRDRESDALIEMGKSRLGNSVSFFTNIPKDEMPFIYNSADIFALCSLQEVFGNVYIEAMSCGIPVIHHCYPVTEWIVGNGGESVDLSRPGNLASIVNQYSKNPNSIKEKGKNARKRATDFFSKEVVLPATIKMYKNVIKDNIFGITV